jgi:hypothetical protein
MYHYRITILCHWKNLTSSSVVVYRTYDKVYNELTELGLLTSYEESMLSELYINLIHLTVDNINYLGNSNVT